MECHCHYTYDSVINVHGMVLASSSSHFLPPTWPRSEVSMIYQHMQCISRIGMCALNRERLSVTNLNSEK